MTAKAVNLDAPKEKLLTADDPPPFTLQKGSQAVIIASPHNGAVVPRKLIDRNGNPLGLPAGFFDTKGPEARHEAMDIRIAEVYDCLRKKLPKANFIESHYSRLVCDKARTEDYAVGTALAESRQPIPGNIDIAAEELEARLDEIYRPYQNALGELISHAHAKAGGAFIIELHSFTPTWHGEPREVTITTLRFEDHPMAQALEESLSEQVGEGFAVNIPYDLTDKGLGDIMACRAISHNYNVWHIVIEIRNDLIRNEKGVKEISGIIEKAVRDTLNHPNYDLFLSRHRD